MEAWRTVTRLRRDERGFALPELLVTILITGIILAIATASWQGATESRQVDSAADQLAADLRPANSSATNQLKDYQAFVDPNTNTSDLSTLKTYQIGPTGSFSSAPYQKQLRG